MEEMELYCLVNNLEASLLEALGQKASPQEPMKKPNHGTLGLTPEKNVYLDYGGFHVELWGHIPLTALKGIADWDETGYFALETNYGQEFYEVEEFLKDMFTRESIQAIGFLEALSQVEGFVVNPAVSEKEPLKLNGEPWKVIDNLAFFKVENGKSLRAIDLNEPTHRMEMQFNGQKWRMVASTFPDGKRKYQALYYCKCME